MGRGKATGPTGEHVDTTLALLRSEDAEGEVQRVLAKLEANGVALPILRLLANAAPIFRPFILMSNGLLNQGRLSPYLRETVILALATRLGVEYEWVEHIKMSARAGVTDAERDALAKPFSADDEHLSEEVRFIVAAALDILDGQLSDTGWHALCRRYDKLGALELIAVVGWWGGMVPTILNSVADRFDLVSAIEA